MPFSSAWGLPPNRHTWRGSPQPTDAVKDLSTWLRHRHDQHLLRQRRCRDGVQGVSQRIDGRDVVAFCSNDYLGLAGDPRLTEAMRDATARHGVGSGAAHLVNGHHRLHEQLEERLAAFTGRARALLFSTGYMANLGVLQALAAPGDQILADRLVHASLLDGAILSRARLRRYAHGDVAALRARLTEIDSQRQTLIVTDGVFSMDGDLAPLTDLATLARTHDATLIVDDAHGLGVLGPNGRGSLEHFGMSARDVPVLIGTLGKAFGTSGAFVAGDVDLIEYLMQTARAYIYTTATPPPIAAATLASLEIVEQEPERRAKLALLVRHFRELTAPIADRLLPSTSPIQGVVTVDSELALEFSRWLLDAGLLVSAIRPPTVPDHSARLRITLSAGHSLAHVERLAEHVVRFCQLNHDKLAKAAEQA
ncbi:MAG: 8-amino-7-oxononanoate synthase [Thiotrichales bacterium]